MKAKNIEKFLNLNEAVHIADSVFEQEKLDFNFLESESPVISIQKFLLVPKLELPKHDFIRSWETLKIFYDGLINYLELEDKINSYSSHFNCNPNNYVFENFPIVKYHDPCCSPGPVEGIAHATIFFDEVDSEVVFMTRINSFACTNYLFDDSKKDAFHKQLTEDIAEKSIKKTFKNRTKIYLIPYSLSELEKDDKLKELKFPIDNYYNIR